MTTTVTANITMPAVKDWVEAHNLTAVGQRTSSGSSRRSGRTLRKVKVHDDGSVTLLRRRRDDSGHFYTVDGKNVASDPVVIPASPPFPLR